MHVVGTLCENNDWFAKDRDLPEVCASSYLKVCKFFIYLFICFIHRSWWEDAAVGDLLVIHDTGAHSHSMGFQYETAIY